MAAKRKRWEPTLLPNTSREDWVRSLKDREEYKGIMQFVRDERDRFFGDLRNCANQDDVMKVAGSIAVLDELLTLLDRE